MKIHHKFLCEQDFAVMDYNKGDILWKKRYVDIFAICEKDAEKQARELYPESFYTEPMSVIGIYDPIGGSVIRLADEQMVCTVKQVAQKSVRFLRWNRYENAL